MFSRKKMYKKSKKFLCSLSIFRQVDEIFAFYGEEFVKLLENIKKKSFLLPRVCKTFPIPRAQKFLTYFLQNFRESNLSTKDATKELISVTKCFCGER